MNGQRLVEPNEARSSPRSITARKGSSVRLHWNYTYVGDGTHNGSAITFQQQSIMFNSTSGVVQLLATKSGQNDNFALQSPVPPPFIGRVEMLSSNSTLVISFLEYNDSSYQFFSGVMLATNITGRPMQPFPLRPYVSITVTGKKILIFSCVAMNLFVLYP